MGRVRISLEVGFKLKTELKDALNDSNLFGNTSNFLRIRERFVYRKIMPIIKSERLLTCVRTKSHIYV